MHLALYRSTGNIEQFQHALRLSHHLAATAEEDQAGNILWSVNTTRMWGFAHGTAGIAFFLLTMYEQTGNPQLKDLVEKAAHALCRAAVETRDPRGWTWSQGPSDQSTLWTHWCNGASGIGRFLLAASRVFHNPTFEHAALAAGYAVCTGRNAGSLCQCHGLAGDGEFLLLLGRSLARSDMHGAALHMAEKLWALQLPLEQNSVRVWRTEHEHAPAYMTGYCGVYSFLLRLLYKNVDFPFFTM
jgi:lantibiotic modifying enzyme